MFFGGVQLFGKPPLGGMSWNDRERNQLDEGVASNDRINHASGGFFKLESQNGSFHFSFPTYRGRILSKWVITMVVTHKSHGYKSAWVITRLTT